ncbi:S8 family serine peptidase [Candidatus Parabeggiatoa sp. HSG14]|uniref:S8 family peptidase n=1 Tax=Candidatus Parabeggiatoa sp. HSG14 TaxID=3055593 RepID=UPI0025A908D3|nr:S8 family serine peptidase [Thiotrichales bacterium HSG14]
MSNTSATSALLKYSPLIGAALLSGLPAITQAKPDNAALLSSQNVTAKALQQIYALQQRKASLTAMQRKVDFHIRHAQEQAASIQNTQTDTISAANPAPKLRSSIKVFDDGTTTVDIKANVTSQLLANITALGGTVISSVERYGAIRARVPLAQVDSLAQSPAIRFIGPAIGALTNKMNTSEGDTAHHPSSVRNTCGVDGSGVKIGVLSDSVDFIAEVQASGDLPEVTILDDAPGNSGEGTALLEILHDLAPKAELYFATAWKGPASFANNILNLRAAGVDIIVDDVGYFNESPFQDDIISQAVNEVTADGALYFAAAGNSGNLNDNESGVWEGDFNSIYDPLWGTAHNFGGGDTTNQVTETAPHAVTLSWSDPLGASANDYDLYLLDPSGNWIVDFSENWQTGSDDPFEMMGYALPGEQIIIVKYAGEDRFLHLSTHRGRLEHGTDGQISGHAAAENAFAVAAVSARAVTSAFDGSESVEFFSSDGPRKMFYDAYGTPFTSNVSSTGGFIRQKPDIAAADGVMVATPGFNPFYGTSAAAPHAAAVAALLLSANPNLTPAQIRTKLTKTALDIEAPGWDRDSGAGIIMAHDCSIYGVNDGGLNNSQHFTVTPNDDFNVQALGPQYKHHDIEGLDINPLTGELFATSGNDARKGNPHGHLYKVNKNSGELTSIGNTGFGEVSAISFRKENSVDDSVQFTLWGWADSEGLIQINTSTGVGTMIAAASFAIEDITWSNDGKLLYGVEETILYQYNSVTGELIQACDNFPSEVEAIEILPDGQLLIALHEANDPSIHSFNIATCSIDVSIEIPPPVNSPIDTPYNDIEGITWYDWASEVMP